MTVQFEGDEPVYPLLPMSDAEFDKEAAFRFDAPGFPGDDEPDLAEDEPVIPKAEPFELHTLHDQRGRSVRTPAEMELEADEIRARMAPRPVSGQIKGPDDVIEDLQWAMHMSAKSAVIIRDADRTLRALQRLYSQRFSIVVKRSKAKAVDERRMETDLILADLVAAMDDAEVVFEYAKRVAKSVEAATSAVQSQGALVKVTYSLAGTGREA